MRNTPSETETSVSDRVRNGDTDIAPLELTPLTVGEVVDLEHVGSHFVRLTVQRPSGETHCVGSSTDPIVPFEEVLAADEVVSNTE